VLPRGHEDCPRRRSRGALPEGLPDFHRLLGRSGAATACLYSFELLHGRASDHVQRTHGRRRGRGHAPRPRRYSRASGAGNSASLSQGDGIRSRACSRRYLPPRSRVLAASRRNSACSTPSRVIKRRGGLGQEFVGGRFLVAGEGAKRTLPLERSPSRPSCDARPVGSDDPALARCRIPRCGLR
jgi:hypothetical protein